MEQEKIRLLRGNENYCEKAEAEPQSNAKGELENIQIISEMAETWQVSRKACIYRVLKCMRIRDVAAYDPLVISFGPYHQGKHPELHAMDQYKEEAVRRMLALSKKDETYLTEKIENLEAKIRECYAEPIEPDRKKLSCMFTKDGCFILEYFKSAGVTRSESDNSLSFFFHNTHTPVESGQCGRWTRSYPSARLLDGAGVTFQPGKLRFEKRMFGKGTLSLPQINVDDTTETLLRNLMAYEECQRCSSNPEDTVISHYVRLLDCLIDSKEDVFVLRNSGIIKSLAGSDDYIASMFNHLAAGTTVSPINEFEKVMEEAMNHYNNHWKVLMSEFQQAHCSKPWYIVSLLAAMALLVMTLIQTLNSF